MSLNASIKKGKGGQESDLRLSSMIGGVNRQKKENLLKKKRTSGSYLEAFNKANNSNYTKEDVERHISMIADPSIPPKDVIESVTFFRRILSSDHVPPINLVINTGLIPRFTSFLAFDDIPELQYESAWVLTNIASGTKDQTATVVDSGALPHLIRLTGSPEMKIREQVVWALGNIAGDNSTYRDGITDSGVIQTLLAAMNGNHSQLLERNTVWLFSNLCRTRDDVPANFEKVCVLLPFLQHCLMSDDDQVIMDALWGFVFITDGNQAQARYVQNMGAAPNFITYLRSNNGKIITPALRAVGNILACPDDMTQVCIDCGVIPCLETLIMSSNSSIVKESLWCLSNIAAGNDSQIQLLLADKIIPIFVELAKGGRNDIKKECCWCICNMVCGGNTMQVAEMAEEYGMVEVMAACLTQDSEERLISIITDSIDRLLRMGRDLCARGLWSSNKVEDWVEDTGMLTAFEKLTLSSTLIVKIETVLGEFFDQDEDIHPDYM